MNRHILSEILKQTPASSPASLLIYFLCGLLIGEVGIIILEGWSMGYPKDYAIVPHSILWLGVYLIVSFYVESMFSMIYISEYLKNKGLCDQKELNQKIINLIRIHTLVFLAMGCVIFLYVVETGKPLFAIGLFCLTLLYLLAIIGWLMRKNKLYKGNKKMQT